MRSLNVLAAAGLVGLLAAVGCHAYRAPAGGVPSRWLTGSRSAGIAVAPTFQVAAAGDARAR